MTLIDSNIILDVVTGDPRWAAWSFHQIRSATLRGPAYINDIVYAEISVGFDAIEECDRALSRLGVMRRPLPDAALFLAGKAFLRYRRRGGTRTGVLPDFFIGAQAAVERLVLLSRDPGRYCSYFPDVRLIAPAG